PEPVLSPDMIALARWMSREYACSLGEAAFSLLPGQMKSHPKYRRVKSLPPSVGEGPPLSSPMEGGGDRGAFVLTPDQEGIRLEIAEALDSRRHQAFLLWGVAAAGKTEIYLNAVEKALAQGGS